MLAASILNEKVLFVFGLVTLFLSGSIVLGINALTDSRRAQLASNIAQSMWGFAPASTQQTQLRRQRWAFRKLIAAGSMMSSLLLSTSVRALKPALAIGLSGGIWSMWCLGVTLFWYYSVEPTAAGADTEAETSAPDPSSRPQEDSRLPVTLITGFLGAGKTTLVKHILSNTAGMKVLVIENEVGEEGIDHDLLLNYAGKEDIVLLKNGCVCCTVRSDLIQTFRAIFQKNLFTALDWVVIETTGLADPAPVIQSLLVDDQCKKYLRLDSVLTVVDSKHITVHLPVSGATIDSEASKGNTSEAALQIAFADRVLLNKVDLVSDDELQQVKDLIVKVNPEADIITCRNAEVDLNEVLNIRTFDPSEFSKTLCMEGERTAATSSMRSSGGFSFLPKDSSGKIDLSKSGKSSLKGSRSNTAPRLVVTPARLGSSHLAAMDVVCTVSLTLPASQPLDFDKLNVWLMALLQRDGADIYRFKGILNIFGYEEQFIMHGVHMIFNGERGSAWRDEQSRRSKIVFIGKNLNADEMDSDFLSCRANLTATNIFTTINFIGSSEEEADKSSSSDKKKL